MNILATLRSDLCAMAVLLSSIKQTLRALGGGHYTSEEREQTTFPQRNTILKRELIRY
jgi:hypothetical protein